jgi:hypothetical protein
VARALAIVARVGTKGLVALSLVALAIGVLLGRMTVGPREQLRRTGSRAPAPDAELPARPAPSPTDSGPEPEGETTTAEAALAKQLGDTPSAAAVKDTAARAAEIRRRALQTAKSAEAIAAQQVAAELEHGVDDSAQQFLALEAGDEGRGPIRSRPGALTTLASRRIPFLSSRGGRCGVQVHATGDVGPGLPRPLVAQPAAAGA